MDRIIQASCKHYIHASGHSAFGPVKLTGTNTLGMTGLQKKTLDEINVEHKE